MTEKIVLGKTNLEISRVVYGGIISMNEQQEESDKYVSYAIDRGVNYFDVAPAYGDARIKLGNSLKAYRKNVFLACKSEWRSENEARLQMKESLDLLHTDYFDVFQLHALTTDDDIEKAFASDGIMNFLVKAKKEGIVRNIGFSAHNEDVGRKALTLFDFDTILFPFNWALGYGSLMGNNLVKDAKNKNLGILALKSLAHRNWLDGEEKNFPKCWYKPIELNSGNELAIAALKYTLSQGVHTIVPPGYFSYFKFVLDNIDECIKNPLNKADEEFLCRELQKIKCDLIF